jgi:hypothetical protein
MAIESNPLSPNEEEASPLLPEIPNPTKLSKFLQLKIRHATSGIGSKDDHPFPRAGLHHETRIVS